LQKRKHVGRKNRARGKGPGLRATKTPKKRFWLDLATQFLGLSAACKRSRRLFTVYFRAGPRAQRIRFAGSQGGRVRAGGLKRAGNPCKTGSKTPSGPRGKTGRVASLDRKPKQSGPSRSPLKSAKTGKEIRQEDGSGTAANTKLANPLKKTSFRRRQQKSPLKPA